MFIHLLLTNSVKIILFFPILQMGECVSWESTSLSKFTELASGQPRCELSSLLMNGYLGVCKKNETILVCRVDLFYQMVI